MEAAEDMPEEQEHGLVPFDKDGDGAWFLLHRRKMVKITPNRENLGSLTYEAH